MKGTKHKRSARLITIKLVQKVKKFGSCIYLYKIYTAKLEYNEHGYCEFTAITNYYSCPGKFLI